MLEEGGVFGGGGFRGGRGRRGGGSCRDVEREREREEGDVRIFLVKNIEATSRSIKYTCTSTIILPRLPHPQPSHLPSCPSHHPSSS